MNRGRVHGSRTCRHGLPMPTGVCVCRSVHHKHDWLRPGLSGVCTCSYGLIGVHTHWKYAGRLWLLVCVNRGVHVVMDSFEGTCRIVIVNIITQGACTWECTQIMVFWGCGI